MPTAACISPECPQGLRAVAGTYGVGEKFRVGQILTISYASRRVQPGTQAANSRTASGNPRSV